MHMNSNLLATETADNVKRAALVRAAGVAMSGTRKRPRWWKILGRRIRT